GTAASGPGGTAASGRGGIPLSRGGGIAPSDAAGMPPSGVAVGSWLQALPSPTAKRSMVGLGKRAMTAVQASYTPATRLPQWQTTAARAARDATRQAAPLAPGCGVPDRSPCAASP